MLTLSIRLLKKILVLYIGILVWEETLRLRRMTQNVIKFLIFSCSLFHAPVASCLCSLITLRVHCNSVYGTQFQPGIVTI